jgi:hypothetical protein
MNYPLPRCKLCGGLPHLWCSGKIVPGESVWAVNCQNSECYNDTHWQMSASAAEDIWRHQQPCVGIRGGQGVADDDKKGRLN